MTSVPFDHASPAAMYAHNVHRDDYQDLARDMLGLPGIAQESDKDGPTPASTSSSAPASARRPTRRPSRRRARTRVKGNPYITDADKAAIDVKNGGKYVVAQTTPGGGDELLRRRRRERRQAGQRLFGFFGTKTLNHLPYRTADGGFDPAPDLDGKAETYTAADLAENPTLADMTRAALTVLAPAPGPLRPVRRGRRRRFRPPREQPRQRRRRRLQRRGRDPGDHRLGRSPQQLGRLGPDRHRRPRPLPRPRRPRRRCLRRRRRRNEIGFQILRYRRDRYVAVTPREGWLRSAGDRPRLPFWSAAATGWGSGSTRSKVTPGSRRWSVDNTAAIGTTGLIAR